MLPPTAMVAGGGGGTAAGATVSWDPYSADTTTQWSMQATFASDVCALDASADRGLDRFAFWRVPAAYAVDSGARFTDFCGQVLVFHHNDPDAWGYPVCSFFRQ